ASARRVADGSAFVASGRVARAGVACAHVGAVRQEGRDGGGVVAAAPVVRSRLRRCGTSNVALRGRAGRLRQSEGMNSPNERALAFRLPAGPGVATERGNRPRKRARRRGPARSRGTGVAVIAPFGVTGSTGGPRHA